MPSIIINIGVDDTVLSVARDDTAKALTDASIPRRSQKTEACNDTASRGSFINDQKLVHIK